MISPAFKTRCEGMATAYRAELGLKAFEPLAGVRLAGHLGAIMLTPKQLTTDYGVSEKSIACLCASESWSALLIGREPPLIIIHPRHAATRVESSLMHELAHWSLRHEPVGWDKSGKPLRRTTDEKEAEYLGGCFQIPRRGLLWAAQQHLTLSETAHHYGASKKMVRFRCNMTGVALAMASGVEQEDRRS